tara:strand:+ start:740 stop:1129 length:390 start_codon:yes stop_codon:yes gene_type:complete
LYRKVPGVRIPPPLLIKQSILNSDFFKNVYEVVKLIPHGKVSSYGAIAKYLGTNKSARVVGWAMNNSHNDSSIPAHRVVNRNGLLSGKHHFPGKETMENLLKKEGILVKNNRIENFEDVFWDPIKELEL